METKLIALAVVYGLILILFAILIKYLYNRIEKNQYDIDCINYRKINELRRDIEKNANHIKALQKGECKTCRFIKEHRQADEEYLFFGHKVRYCPECGADTEENKNNE